MDKFFRFISWVFMPLNMPVLALVFVMYVPSQLDMQHLSNNLYVLNPAAKQFFIRSFALFGWVFPVISILILRYSRQIDSIQLDDQKQRTAPLFLTSMYAAMLLALLVRFHSQVNLSIHLFALAASGMVGGLFCLLLNFKFKISLHAYGVGIFLGFIISYFMEQSLVVAWPLFLSCILSGVIISSRIFLQKHTNSQLLIGFSSGFFITLLADILFILYI